MKELDKQLKNLREERGVTMKEVSTALTSAFIAHASTGDGPDKFMAPVIFGGILIGSYVTYRKCNAENVGFKRN